MTLEESLNFIRTEFMKELDKRKELLDKIVELQEDNEQLKRDLKAYLSFYPMKNEVCRKCMFADECLDENRVEGKRLCSSFHAKLESEEQLGLSEKISKMSISHNTYNRLRRLVDEIQNET